MAHMLGSNVNVGFVDKRRSGTTKADKDTHVSRGTAGFTANASGTTTTIVGANAAPGTNDVNVVRRGEKFRLFNSSGVLKEETVFEITSIAVAASTTVTFSPAAAVATASGDVARLVDLFNFQDEETLDSRLIALGYTQATINAMTQNDKVYAIRLADDSSSI